MKKARRRRPNPRGIIGRATFIDLSSTHKEMDTWELDPRKEGKLELAAKSRV